MTNPYRDGSLNRSASVYHTDGDCPRGAQIGNPIPVDPDDREDLTECQWCAGEVEHKGGSGPKLANVLEGMDA